MNCWRRYQRRKLQRRPSRIIRANCCRITTSEWLFYCFEGDSWELGSDKWNCVALTTHHVYDQVIIAHNKWLLLEEVKLVMISPDRSVNANHGECWSSPHHIIIFMDKQKLIFWNNFSTRSRILIGQQEIGWLKCIIRESIYLISSPFSTTTSTCCGHSFKCPWCHRLGTIPISNRGNNKLWIDIKRWSLGTLPKT